jgi:GNAT superfamily N-acetyltransferase
MSVPVQTTEVLDSYQKIIAFLPSVIEAADGERNALGFFPSSVFNDFACKEQLLVAIRRQGDLSSYAGHLLFEARHPKASVRQMFVAPQFRKLGIATLLLDHLKKQLTAHAFISMYARVAEDLVGANKFWEQQGFYVQRIVAGGERRKRKILVRSHELNTPQLFAPSGLSKADPLGLNAVRVTEVPLFLLDLNVLFDLGPRRSRNEDILELFRAERLGSCKLALSTEINAELKRTAHSGVTDPMQGYARIFPTFRSPPDAEWDSLRPILASIVFPVRYKAGLLSSNDISDLRHLATAICHRLAGLVTNDASILQAAGRLKQDYEIQVISPSAFKDRNAIGMGAEVFETASSETLSLAPVTHNDEAVAHELLSRLGLSGSVIVSEWAAIDGSDRLCHRQGVWFNDVLVGYVMWKGASNGNGLHARVAVDETQSQALNAARVLLGCLTEQAASAGTTQVRIEFPLRQARIREVAGALGFGGLEADTSLTKLVLGRVVTQSNWKECRDELFLASNLLLPDSPPVFKDVDQQIRLVRPDGNVMHMPLTTLESLLAPGLFCLPGRLAVISPVRRDFSEHLLDHLPQRSLLPFARATLYREKHYLSGAATLKHFKRGNLILFYESAKKRGLGAVVALARVQHAYLKAQAAMEESDLDPSVLDSAGLEAIGRSKTKTVTVFDNLIRFEHPVPLLTLQRLSCGSPADLVTTHPINDIQLQEILDEGFTYGKQRTRPDLA